MKKIKVKMQCWEMISKESLKKLKSYQTSYKPCSPVLIEVTPEGDLMLKYLRKVKVDKDSYQYLCEHGCIEE